MLSYLLNTIWTYIYVQTAILLFIAPFYWFYRRKQVHAEGPPKNLSEQIENFFLSKASNWLVFFWALGEALVWFVIPEFLLLLVIFMRIHRKRELLLYDVAGTVAGTILAFFTHVSDKTIASLPFIQDKMVEQTHVWYEHSGLWGLLYQPFSGVPYKVFTLTATNHHFFILTFILVAVIVRMSRYAIFFGIFSALFQGMHGFVYKRYVKLFFIATFIFSIFLVRVVHNFGPDYKINYFESGKFLTK